MGLEKNIKHNIKQVLSYTLDRCPVTADTSLKDSQMQVLDCEEKSIKTLGG